MEPKIVGKLKAVSVLLNDESELTLFFYRQQRDGSYNFKHYRVIGVYRAGKLAFRLDSLFGTEIEYAAKRLGLGWDARMP